MWEGQSEKENLISTLHMLPSTRRSVLTKCVRKRLTDWTCCIDFIGAVTMFSPVSCKF